MAKRKAKPKAAQTDERKVERAPAVKSARGETSNVGNFKGITLTEMPEAGTEQPQATQEANQRVPTPEPAPAPLLAPRPVRLQIQAEMSMFPETAETLEAAKARAEEIIAKGAWQEAGTMLVLHGPTAIRRVKVIP